MPIPIRFPNPPPVKGEYPEGGRGWYLCTPKGGGGGSLWRLPQGDSDYSAR